MKKIFFLVLVVLLVHTRHTSAPPAEGAFEGGVGGVDGGISEEGVPEDGTVRTDGKGGFGDETDSDEPKSVISTERSVDGEIGAIDIKNDNESRTNNPAFQGGDGDGASRLQEGSIDTPQDSRTALPQDDASSGRNDPQTNPTNTPADSRTALPQERASGQTDPQTNLSTEQTGVLVSGGQLGDGLGTEADQTEDDTAGKASQEILQMREANFESFKRYKTILESKDEDAHLSSSERLIIELEYKRFFGEKKITEITPDEIKAVMNDQESEIALLKGGVTEGDIEQYREEHKVSLSKAIRNLTLKMREDNLARLRSMMKYKESQAFTADEKEFLRDEYKRLFGKQKNDAFIKEDFYTIFKVQEDEIYLLKKGIAKKEIEKYREDLGVPLSLAQVIEELAGRQYFMKMDDEDQNDIVDVLDRYQKTLDDAIAALNTNKTLSEEELGKINDIASYLDREKISIEQKAQTLEELQVMKKIVDARKEFDENAINAIIEKQELEKIEEKYSKSNDKAQKTNIELVRKLATMKEETYEEFVKKYSTDNNQGIFKKRDIFADFDGLESISEERKDFLRKDIRKKREWLKKQRESEKPNGNVIRALLNDISFEERALVIGEVPESKFDEYSKKYGISKSLVLELLVKRQAFMDMDDENREHTLGQFEADQKILQDAINALNSGKEISKDNFKKINDMSKKLLDEKIDPSLQTTPDKKEELQAKLQVMKKIFDGEKEFVKNEIEQKSKKTIQEHIKALKKQINAAFEKLINFMKNLFSGSLENGSRSATQLGKIDELQAQLSEEDGSDSDVLAEQAELEKIAESAPIAQESVKNMFKTLGDLSAEGKKFFKEMPEELKKLPGIDEQSATMETIGQGHKTDVLHQSLDAQKRAIETALQSGDMERARQLLKGSERMLQEVADQSTFVKAKASAEDMILSQVSDGFEKTKEEYKQYMQEGVYHYFGNSIEHSSRTIIELLDPNNFLKNSLSDEESQVLVEIGKKIAEEKGENIDGIPSKSDLERYGQEGKIWLERYKDEKVYNLPADVLARIAHARERALGEIALKEKSKEKRKKLTSESTGYRNVSYILRLGDFRASAFLLEARSDSGEDALNPLKDAFDSLSEEYKQEAGEKTTLIQKGEQELKSVLVSMEVVPFEQQISKASTILLSPSRAAIEIDHYAQQGLEAFDKSDYNNLRKRLEELRVRVGEKSSDGSWQQRARDSATKLIKEIDQASKK